MPGTTRGTSNKDKPSGGEEGEISQTVVWVIVGAVLCWYVLSTLVWICDRRRRRLQRNTEHSAPYNVAFISQLRRALGQSQRPLDSFIVDAPEPVAYLNRPIHGDLKFASDAIYTCEMAELAAQYEVGLLTNTAFFDARKSADDSLQLRCNVAFDAAPKSHTLCCITRACVALDEIGEERIKPVVAAPRSIVQGVVQGSLLAPDHLFLCTAQGHLPLTDANGQVLLLPASPEHQGVTQPLPNVAVGHAGAIGATTQPHDGVIVQPAKGQPIHRLQAGGRVLDSDLGRREESVVHTLASTNSQIELEMR